jgi:hydroxymethylpyrimidine/phosphomethylpyrimidine kinase
VVTPNLPEAAGLAGFPVQTRDEMKRAAEAIVGLGARSVLVKGGHMDETGRASDLFFDGDCMEWLDAERIDTPHTHGTGCVLSAAITAHLARGAELLDAVTAGKQFVTDAIRGALQIGQGIGPVNPLFEALSRSSRPSP